MHMTDQSANRGRIRPNRRRYGTILAGLAVLFGTGTAVAQVNTYSVGPGGDGCTHTTLQAAVATATTAPGGPHLIKLRRNNTYQLDSRVEIVNPAADITLDGGYTSCTDSGPSNGNQAIITRHPGTATTSLIYLSNAVANPRRTIRFERLTLRDGVAPAASLQGGAISVLGRITAVLTSGTRVQDNQARNGGGVYLLGLTAGENDYSELVLNGVTMLDNEATPAAVASGGAIYGAGNVRVRIASAFFQSNRARDHGGAIFLTGERARLELIPPPGDLVEFRFNNAGPTAFDPGAPFNAERGFGGAISITGGATMTTSASRTTGNGPAIQFLGNTAHFGGAIHAEGGTSEFSFAQLNNALVSNNWAYGKGGAFYIKNAMDFTFRSWGAGPCSGNLPCSTALSNVAYNETYGTTTPGGGVAYVTTDAGSSRAIFRSGGVLYRLNRDTDGTAAVATAWGNDSKLSFVRSIFDGNQASGSASFRAMIDSPNNDVTFYFNTVVGQHSNTSRLFYTNPGRMIEAQGSIFWQGVSTPITNAPAAGKVVPGDAGQRCLNLHSEHMSELSVTDDGAISNLNPRLDASYAIRPRGEIDACAASRGDVHYTAEYDAWRLPTDVDVPSITNWEGPVDMGAIERGDIIMHNGFGHYPNN